MRGEKIDSSVLSSTTGPSDFDDVKDFEKAEPSIPGVSIGYDDEEYALEGANGAWVHLNLNSINILIMSDLNDIYILITLAF